MSRSLLTKRLHELARSGLVVIQPKPDAHGSFYEPTPAGRAAGGVLEAIAVWAENWAEVRPEHSDPGLVLFPWCRHSLRDDRVPRRRLVVRFEFEQSGRHIRSWMLLEEGTGEICIFDPGFGDDLVVAIADPLTFTRWHLGLTSWARRCAPAASKSAALPLCVARCRPGTPPQSSPGAGSPSTNAVERACHGVQNYPARLTRNPEAAVFPWGEGAKLSSAGGDRYAV